MDDKPLRIAVVGAGPIGLEAAIYGRYLGYDVTVLEKGEVAENVRDWGHVTMFSPFRLSSSPLGIAALEAQDATHKFPDADSYLTGNQWYEEYLSPLAASDLLSDSIKTNTTVVAIGRDKLRKTDTDSPSSRHRRPFRILCRDTASVATADHEWYLFADVVIDASGIYGNSNGLGPGGLPARGESAVQSLLEHRIPDHRTQHDRYAGRRILVVGAGFSAATTIDALSKIAESSPGTRVVWLVRRTDRNDPLVRIPEDPLPRRDQLARQINAWAHHTPAWLEFRPGCWVESLQMASDNRVAVQWVGADEGGGEFDRVIANVGYRPDRELYRELQVQECSTSEVPMRLAARLLAAPRVDATNSPETDAVAMCTSESDFYIVGSKSYGRNPHFLFHHGLEQIRHVYAMIGERAELDVYSTIRRTREASN